MSTDHTSESSWEAGFDPAGPQSFVTPTFDEEAENGPDPNLDSTSEQPSDRAATRQPELEEDQDLEQSAETASAPESAAEPEAESAADSLRESVRSGAADAIEFRVSRPGTPIRRLRLTGNRYTFGSAEGCSIRLNDRELRPMHAVLIREASRTLVRAYSLPLDVNGTRVTEAELHPGDVLSLGAYRFELLDDEATSSPRPQAAFDDARPWRSLHDSSHSRTFGGSSVGGDRIGLGTGLSSAEDVIWKDRLRREIEQWRERQVDCDRRENRCDEREAKLRDRETELWSRAENLYRRESRLQSQEAATFQLYDEFTRHQQELIQVREAAQKKQESFHQREIAFRNQELEYRQRLEEATRQLNLSQEEAANANQAVQRMREQFDSLNQQIEELSGQHTTIERREQEQRQEQKELLAELEASRDEALKSQADSEAKRHEAEARLEQLEAQLELLQNERGSDLTAQQKRLAESEQAAQTLRKQVQELQEGLSEATEESARLRADYEEAFASVTELESIIAKTSQSSDKDRESWEAEADELRASMERLSLELSKANRELGELRDANAQLNARLDDMQRQRDEARADADARPTPEAFQSLQDELTATSDQLASVRDDYEVSLQELSDVQRARELEQEKASQTLADALEYAEANRLAEPIESVDRTADPFDELDDQVAEESHEFLIDDDDSDQSSWDDSSAWNLDSPEPEDDADDRGSLANLLIRDLEEESQSQNQEAEAYDTPDTSSELPVDTELESDNGWDLEHDEEAFPSRWKNDPEGFRVEEIEAADLVDQDASESTDSYQDAELVDEPELVDESELETLQHDELHDEVRNEVESEINPVETAANLEDDDSEDSIEAYMNRLLRRVHGQPLDEAPKPETDKESKGASNEKKKADDTPVVAAAKLDPDAPYIARSKAPEKSTSLSAMRELANSSARIAISRSVREQTRDIQIKGAFSFACAAGAIVCGIACYLFIPDIMRYLAVAMTVVVALIYLREGWLRFREASRQLKAAEQEIVESNAKTPDAESADAESADAKISDADEDEAKDAETKVTS